MKRFKTFIHEQKLSSQENTLDPDFLEKKERKDRQVEKRLEKPTKEVEQEAKHDEEV